MSKTKNRNSLLSTHNRAGVSSNIKDDLLAMKYTMDTPATLLYPLNDIDKTSENLVEHSKQTTNSSHEELTFPDFKPWKDTSHLSEERAQIEIQKLNNESYLNKGYFEGPLVANEYYSARNLVQASLFSSSTNCDKVLKELSQHLVNSYRTRNEVINKIKHNSNSFKVPPRVTLTTLKKEAWLRDLANPDVPLLKISNKLPHGIKNKMLVDILCSKNIPITRALWFTKCVLFSELIVLRKRHQTKLPHSNLQPMGNAGTSSFETQWLQEWTHQLVDYVHKFSKEMSSIATQEKKLTYLTKLNYLLNYVQSLYIECLVDKSFLITSILKFLKEGLPLDQSHISDLLTSSRSEGEESPSNNWIVDIDLNYGLRLVSITLVKMFWKDILALDYLSKELSELLLINYYFIEKIPTYNMKPGSHASKHNHISSLSLSLKLKILTNISDTVSYLFKYNTNVFIIPNYWILVNEILYKILLGDASIGGDSDEQKEIRRQLKLIKYRNESLMLNMKHVHSTSNAISVSPNNEVLERRKSVSILPSYLQDSKSVDALFTSKNKTEIFDNDSNIINRSNDDTLNIIDQLDRLKLNDSLAELLMPTSFAFSSEDLSDWKINLKILIYWAITPYREQNPSSENILIICNFLKRKVLQNVNMKNATNLRAEFENEILEIICNLAYYTDIKILYYNLYVLINELYQLKVITISTYLRKLIASGIFYLSPDKVGSQEYAEDNFTIQTHLEILQNLPVLNNKQCDSILKKWTPNGFNFEEKFEKGKQILREELVDRLILNSFDEYIQEDLGYFKDLKVGLKFLLVNWVTNEIKTSITKSPKLIHINPNTVTSLYNFYALCDNLTVFFKVLIKFILRNEGRILIYYMDSLYLISKIIIRHFKLVKFIAGNSYESSTTGYELFKLIILNYKDLLTRDNDYYNFSDVWQFIDNVVEKNDSSDEKRTENGPEDTLKSKKFNQLLFSKETVDSPMKIYGNNHSPHKGGENYTSTDFRNDLDILLEAPIRLLSNSEISDFATAIEIDVKDEVFNDVSGIKKLVETLINYFYENVGLITESEENSCMRLLINAQRSSCIINKDTFLEIVREGIVNATHGKFDMHKLNIFIKKLLCFEVYELHELLPLIKSISVHEVPGDQLDTIIYDLFFGSLKTDSENLFNDQLLTLNFIRYLYVKRHSNVVFAEVLENLRKGGIAILDSPFSKIFKNEIVSFLQQFLLFNTKSFVDGVFKTIPETDIVSLLNALTYSAKDLTEHDDLVRLANCVNEFNLPACQVLIKVIVITQLKDLSDTDAIQALKNVLNKLLDNVSFNFVSYNSYFGELFNYLCWEHKLNIFFILQDQFLCKTEFNSETTNNDDARVYLMSDDGRKNVLPVIKDFFKKFSVSSLCTVTTTTKDFHNLSEFLQKLLKLANSDIIFTEDSRHDTYNVISIFVRILIIHKFSLTSMILESDSQNFHFIKDLILLRESKFLSSNNEKLRILLYDLLLLMKSSITLSVTLNQESNAAGDLSSEVAMSDQHGSTEDILSKRNTDNPDGPVNYKYFGLLNVSRSMNLSSVFNISEPNISYPLKKYTNDSKVECALTLDESELRGGGDIHAINESKLILLPSRRETLRKAFDILNDVENEVSKGNFNLKSYEILDDTGSELNSGCINLLLFDSFTTKENPP